MAKQGRVENLIPHQFKPGQSGNPSGRPKGTLSLSNLLRKQLEEVVAEDGRTAADMLVATTVRAALKGDKAARQLAWEYIDGKPSQHIDLNANISEVQIIDDLGTD